MPTNRLPNLLHFLILIALTIFATLLCAVGVLAVNHLVHPQAGVVAALKDQRIAVGINMGSYVVALALAWVTMPLFWHRPFVEGVEWRGAAVRWQLAALGLVLGFAAQGLTVFIPHTKDLPVEDLFRHPESIWLLAIFGSVVGPIFEEIVFRGFMLPGLAIAVDWMRLPRQENALRTLEAWRAGSGYSRQALGIASVVTSLLFALIHGLQLAWTWPALALLFCVSLVLCAVRIRLRSVAASALVHGCYNLSVFITLFLVTGGFRHLEKM